MESSKEKSLPVVVFGRDEFIAGLVNTDIRNPLRHTKAIENGQIMRQKGFTDMEPGMLRLVDQHHAPPALGKETRRRRPCRSSADYGNIVAIVAGDFGPLTVRSFGEHAPGRSGGISAAPGSGPPLVQWLFSPSFVDAL